MLAKPMPAGAQSPAVVGTSAHNFMQFAEGPIARPAPYFIGAASGAPGFALAEPALPAPAARPLSPWLGGTGVTGLVARAFLDAQETPPVAAPKPAPASAPAKKSSIIAGREYAIAPEALATLRDAQKSGHYDVRLAARTVNGKNQLIVMLGESHKKNKEAYVLGDKITDHFDFRGLEGADVSKMLGGRLISVFIDMASKLAMLFSFGKMSRGSTIHEADLDDLPPQVHKFFKMYLSEIAKREKLAEKSPEALAAYKTELKISQGDVEKVYSFTGPQILEIIKGQRDVFSQKVVNVPLEAGHVPDWAEHAASVYLPGSLLFSVAYMGVEFAEGYIPALGPVADVMSVPFWAGTAFFYGGWILGKFVKPSPNSPVNFLLKPVSGIGIARNKTMAANTVKAFADHPDQTVILDIVGRAHNPGMMEYFVKDYGFEEVPLPGA